jgi:hypothetical protein
LREGWRIFNHEWARMGRGRGGGRQREGAEWRSREAAAAAGVGGVLMDIRGCRLVLAQPPANRWHPSGMGDGGWRCGWVSERGGRVAGGGGFLGIEEGEFNHEWG